VHQRSTMKRIVLEESWDKGRRIDFEKPNSILGIVRGGCGENQGSRVGGSMAATRANKGHVLG